MEDNPVSNSWARRIIRSVKFTEGLRGDFLRKTKDSAYIGSGGSQVDSPHGVWRPQPFIVKEEFDDYLKCRPYVPQTSTEGEVDVFVAKPLHLQKTRNEEARTIAPPYVVDETLVWAAPFLQNGTQDTDGNYIGLVDMNTEGRSTDVFPAKITGGSLDSSNQGEYTATEQRRTSSGWEDLPDGRSVTMVLNGVEANNSASGVQGNGVDLDGQIFTDNGDLEIKEIRGEPVVRVYEEVTSDGTKVYSIHAWNAIDGECA